MIGQPWKGDQSQRCLRGQNLGEESGPFEEVQMKQAPAFVAGTG
jgi:hypothetical protein